MEELNPMIAAVPQVVENTSCDMASEHVHGLSQKFKRVATVEILRGSDPNGFHQVGSV